MERVQPVTNKKPLKLPTKRVGLLFLLALALLLARAPHLLATGANNLAARALVSEWQEVSQQVDLPRCEKQLEHSMAARYAMTALHWNPRYGRALVNQGRVAWLEGRCSEAWTGWEQALQATPTDQVTAFWLFWASGADTDELPNNLSAGMLVQAAYGAGWRAETAGAESAAVAWYELSLDLNPTRETADRLARLYQQEDQLEEAIAAWQRVASALPRESPDHWWALGQAAELAQEWERAAWAYGQGIEVAEESYDFWIQQGVAFERLQQWKNATKAYHQALLARPDLAGAYLGLGHVHRKQQNYVEALDWYRRAEAAAPGQFGPVYHQGLTYYFLESNTKAQSYLERALAINTDHAKSNYYLSQTLYSSGDIEQAVVFMTQAVASYKGQPWQWAVQLGDWHLELGDREGAMAAYQQALEWRPGEEKIERRLGEIGEE